MKGMLETDQTALRDRAAAMQEKKEALQTPVALQEAPQEETGLKTRLHHQQVQALCRLAPKSSVSSKARKNLF